ncbi:MAG: aminotransferase class V-fold PLP-dependent enzyme, partial [Sporichthyaceae bacterium]
MNEAGVPAQAVSGAYFDAASTEPLHPAARRVWSDAIERGWADPARLYRDGRRARALLDDAREAVAALLGVGPEEVSFTSSGTAALELGISGCLRGRARVGRHLVTSAVEHSAVLHTAAIQVAAGGTHTAVGVDGAGQVDASDFAAALLPGTALAVLQSANHEVGTVQPLAEVAAACANAGVPLLVDAAQSLGRLPVPAGWSALAASAHKWGGPPGVGVLAGAPRGRGGAPGPRGAPAGGGGARGAAGP